MIKGLYAVEQWISDIDEVLKELPVIQELKGSSVLVTGSTGLVCSAVVDLLIRWNETHDGKIRIIAAGRSEEKIQNRFGEFAGKEWFRPLVYDSNLAEFHLDEPVDFIIHGASNAYPSAIAKESVETMDSNYLGMKALLDFAKKSDVKRLLFISSSEVYGRKESAESFREDEYGFIDILNPRNSYSVAKRAAETLCASYKEEYGVDFAVVRPGHIYGPTASAQDNRVSSAWVYAAARGEDIVMKSDGAQIRSYCHCLDCASAILAVLAKGQSGEAYNISNPSSVISIRQLAEILAETAGVKLVTESASEEEKKAFNPMSNSSLNSERLEALGWRGLFDAKSGLAHSVAIIKERTS